MIFGDSQSRISPKFPSVNDAIERRHQQREAIAARTLAVVMFAGIGVAFWSSFGLVMTIFGGLGFVITCFYAGNRQYERQLKNGSSLRKPFL
jgi:1,4-dihydroxy-2-naphthoate octaprenyltransferase